MFGKYYVSNGKKPRLVWVGPLTQEEMEQDFDEFRHNKKEEKGKK